MNDGDDIIRFIARIAQYLTYIIFWQKLWKNKGWLVWELTQCINVESPLQNKHCFLWHYSTTHWPNVGLMLAQRLGRWPKINLASGQCLVFAVKCETLIAGFRWAYVSTVDCTITMSHLHNIFHSKSWPAPWGQDFMLCSEDVLVQIDTYILWEMTAEVYLIQL